MMPFSWMLNMTGKKTGIEINIESLGMISMRPFLEMGDFRKLGLASDITPINFTAQLMAQMIQTPRLDATDLIKGVAQYYPPP